MDVGAFIGHDSRRLEYDGAPFDQTVWSDIVSHFDLGYAFFRDREHSRGRFIETDFLSTHYAELVALQGKVDIIVVSQVLQQWDWEGQIKAAQALASVTKPGPVISGNHIENAQSQGTNLKAGPGPVWRHDPGSPSRSWEAVGQGAGTQWETHAWLRTVA